MIETEVKIIGIDRRAVEKRLNSLGARKVFDGTLDGTIFDFPGLKLKRSGRLLRLRREGHGKTTLAAKKMISTAGAKRATEIEVGVPDSGKMRKLLGALGFAQVSRKKKKRTSYRLGSLRFEIDKYPGIPPFLEIEGKTGKALVRGAKLLGFRKGDLKSWTTWDLFRHYGKK